MGITIKSIMEIMSKTTPIYGLNLWVVMSASTCILTIISVITFLLARGCCSSFHKGKRKNPAMSNGNTVGASNPSPSGFQDVVMGNIGRNNMDRASEIWGRPAAMNLDLAVPSWNRAENIGVFSLAEIQIATNYFGDQNMTNDHAYYGVLFRGELRNGTRVAVKLLQCNSGAAEDFRVKAEEIGDIRHKNVVELYGYCTEGAFRSLVYEYVGNGNLHWWLHECGRLTSPLSWDIRLKIMLGTAKGLVYLHTQHPDLLYQHIESGNVLLDRQWNPRIFNVGIHQLSGPDFQPHLKALGYSAPEYFYTGIFNEKTDVYSFGMLLIELISGMYPNNFYLEAEPEGKLIDWFKNMAGMQDYDHILDPKVRQIPPSVELKKIIFIALRCTDLDAVKRPSMEDVISMFQPRGRLITEDYQMLFGTTDETDTAWRKDGKRPAVVKEMMKN